MKRALSFIVVSVLAGCGSSLIRPAHVHRDPAPPPQQAAITYGLSGSVSEATADGVRSVEGVTVGVGDDFGNFMSGFTDTEGRYAVQGLSAGTWQLRVSKDGYETAIRTIQVSGDMPFDVELRSSSNQQ
jgi:hypothetical protein